MIQALVSFVAFQACWFACVGGAARGIPWAGPLAVAAFVAAQLRTIPSSAERSRQGWALGLAAVLGYAADSALVLAGVLTFPSQAVLGWPSTMWMVSLWVLQAATLRGVMAWMKGRFTLAALLGAIGGPMAYLAGERLGAAVLGPSHTAALALIAVEWALAMPLLVWMAQRAMGSALHAPGAAGMRFAR